MKYDECAKASASALRNDPDMKFGVTNLGLSATNSIGLAYMNQGKYEEGEKCFRRTLKLLALVYFNLGLTLIKQDRSRYQEALLNFQRAVELEPEDAEYLDLLGDAYQRFGRLEEAEGVLCRSPSINGNDARTHYELGLVYAKMGNHQEEALQHYEHAVALNGDLGHCYYGIACIYALQGKKKLALEFLEKALQNGYRDIAYIEKDSDLNNLRNEPEFLTLADGY